jgi:PKD repeat protein
MNQRLTIHLACALVLAGLVAVLPAAASGNDPLYLNAKPTAGVDLESYVSIDGGTTWLDADTPPGPHLLQSGPAPRFRFVITNIGTANLASVELTETVLGNLTVPATITAGASAEAVVNGTWTTGQNAGVATVDATGSGQAVTDADAACYFGAAPAIEIAALTNGEEADTPPGPTVPVGSTVAWTYVVTNAGNVPLAAVTVTDDRGVTVTAPKTALAPGESMTATASGIAAAGLYANNGTAAGTPPSGPAVSATDPSHYYGVVPVEAGFEANAPGGTAPLTVQFTDASSGDGLAGWSWDFGDGGTSTEQSPVHVYADPGTYTVTLSITGASGTDSETKIDCITVTSGVQVLTVPPAVEVPTDPDLDGLHEDVNGNGRIDFADIVLYFNSMAWIAANEPVSAFDYNGNGRIDFSDVVWLFNRL